MVIGTVLNIVLDPVFILVFGMGVSGAAWATIIGNLAAVIFYLFIYLRGKTIVSIRPCDFKPSVQIFREVLKIGLPSSVSQILGSVTMVLFNNLAAGYGDAVVSAYGVALKMIQMEFMILFGYISGYVPFAGYYYGAVPFTVLAPAYMSIFTSSREIIEIGTQFLHAQAWAVPIMAVQVTLMNTYQATGQAFRAMLVRLGRQCLF